jgi:hypothetical protein
MGYISSLSGSIELSRALTDAEAGAAVAAQDSDWDYFEIRANDWSTSLELTIGEGKAYRIEEALNKVIEALPEDVTGSGYIEIVGEEQPDMWRLHVRGRRVVHVDAVISWPKPE